MSAQYNFDIQIAGSENAIQALIKSLEAEPLQLNAIKPEDRDTNGKSIVRIACGGVSEQSLKNVLIKHLDETQQLNLIVEAYATEKEEKTQEHILIDRGQMMAGSQEHYKEYKVSELSERELEDLLFEEGFEQEELMEQLDENGIYRTDEMEFYGQFNDLVSFFEHEPRLFLEYTSQMSGVADFLMNELGLTPPDPNELQYYVTPVLDMYRNDDNLYMEFGYYDEENQMLAPFTSVTVNIAPLPYLHSAIDTNNNGIGIVNWLQEHGFGGPIGQTLNSGFCQFPVFRFNEDKLREIDPKGFDEYAKAHGKERVAIKKTLDAQIQQAQEKTGGQRGHQGDKTPER